MPTKLVVASQVGGVVYIGRGNGVWMYVGNVGCGHGVGGYGACMRNHMIVYPRCVVKRECCMYWGVVKDVNRTLFMFATKFDDKRESSCPIEWLLYLCNEAV